MLSLLCLVFCAAHVASAQEQEADIAKKLQTRNVDVAPLLFQNKAFLTDYSFNGGSRGAYVKSFLFVNSFKSKTFATHAYGTNNYWGGDFKYEANTSNYSNRSAAVKPFETKTSETKTARESGKETATRTYATSEFRARGKSQDRFDKEGTDAFKGGNPIGLQGDMHTMTIAEVRELLNKNK